MKKGCRVFVACLFVIFPAAAHAQLTLRLEKPNQAGSPGATLSYIGTLTIIGAMPVFLSGDSFTLDSPNFTLDDSSFLAALGGITALNEGNSYTGEFSR